MKLLGAALLTFAFFSFAGPVEVSAQAAIFVGGGLTVPTGDFSDFDGSGPGTDGASAGWQGTAGILFNVGESGLAAGARGIYGSNNHDTSGEKTNLYGATALGNYGFGEPDALNPFLWAEVGWLTHQFKADGPPETSASDSGTVLAGGAGLGLPLGGLSGFVAAGYSYGLGGVDGTTFFGGYAGVNFPLGGGM